MSLRQRWIFSWKLKLCSDVLVESQRIPGRRPNIMQMAAGCLCLCLTAELTGKWREPVSKDTECGPKVSRNKMFPTVGSMQ